MALTANTQKVRLSSVARSEEEWKQICEKLYQYDNKTNSIISQFIPALGEKIIFCDDTGNNLYYCIGDGKTPLYIKATSRNEKGEEVTEWTTNDETTLVRSQSMAPVSFKATNTNAPDYLHQEPADDKASNNSPYQIASEAEVDALHNANSVLESRLNTLEATANNLIEEVTNISNIMTFKGVVEELPSTETQPEGYTNGDVVLCSRQEYVLVEDQEGKYSWEPFGNADLLTQLNTEVYGPKVETDDLPESRIDINAKNIDELDDRIVNLETMEKGMFGNGKYGPYKTISSNNLPKASIYNGSSEGQQGQAGIVHPRRDLGLIINEQGHLGLRQAQIADLQKVTMEKNDVAYTKDSQGKDSYGWFPVFTGNIGYLINKYLTDNNYLKDEEIGQWLENSYNLISGNDSNTQVNPNEGVKAWCIEDIVNAIKELKGNFYNQNNYMVKAGSVSNVLPDKINNTTPLARWAYTNWTIEDGDSKGSADWEYEIKNTGWLTASTLLALDFSEYKSSSPSQVGGFYIIETDALEFPNVFDSEIGFEYDYPTHFPQVLVSSDSRGYGIPLFKGCSITDNKIRVDFRIIFLMANGFDNRYDESFRVNVNIKAKLKRAN